MPASTSNFENHQYIRPGLEYLLMRIQQKRQSVQPNIIKALDCLIENEVIEDIEKWCRQVFKEGDLNHTGIQSSSYACEQAQHHIAVRLQKLYTYQSFVTMPDEKEEHHDMRIAAKRMRYTMELFSDFYEKEFKEFIRIIKRLQELLGDLHDCDVWIDYLSQFIKEERDRAIEFFGNDTFFRFIEPGIVYLRDAQEQRRQEIYESFVMFWQDNLDDMAFKNQLEVIIRG